MQLFPKFKNRRFKPYEFELELTMAKLFHRRPRTYFYDMPTYDWLPPEPKVNFDLVHGFNKGQH